MQLNKENYFSNEANRKFMSVSTFKSILECESKAHAKLHLGYDEGSKKAFEEGHYLHHWNEGTLEEFKKNNPQLYSTRGATAGQLKSDYKKINEIIEMLEQDENFLKALAGEKEKIFTGELFGIPWKITVDSISDKWITDLKFIKSITDRFYSQEFGMYVNFIGNYRYDIQAAIYQEIEFQNSKNKKEFMIAAVDKAGMGKDNISDHEVITFYQEDLEQALKYVRQNIERVKIVWKNDIKELKKEGLKSCGVCNYCKANKKINNVKHWNSDTGFLEE